MPTITYLDLEGDGKPVTWRNIELAPGKAVNVDDEGMLHQASSNPHFKVSGYKPDTKAHVVGSYDDPAAPGGTVTLMRQSAPGVYGGSASVSGPVGVSADTTISTSTRAANPVAAAPDLEASMIAHYGTANPLESQQPGKPPEPSRPSKEVEKTQREQSKRK